MDNAEYVLISNIRDELRAVAERIEELSNRLEESNFAALRGERAVSHRCRALTRKGHQCTRRATGHGDLAGYCKTHEPTILYIQDENGYREKHIERPPSAIRV